VLTPKNSPRGQLLQQYVLARVVTMTGIDIGLFDYDRHNSIYFFAMNASEHIYLRYGGRDSADPNTYLDLNSLDLALQSGLRQHELYKTGKFVRQRRAAPFFQEQIASLKAQVIDQNRCVECHLIGDYSAQDQEKAGTLDKRRTLFRSPDIKSMGIHLDVPKGLAIARAEGIAAAAGLKSGDVIAAFNGTPVVTFGDLQYRFGDLNRDSRQVRITVHRGGAPRTVTMRLPLEWWFIDTAPRYWTVEPMVYFTTKPLLAAKKRELGLNPKGFAAEVADVDPLAASLKVHSLQRGDIVYEINGVGASRITARPEVHLKLTTRAGDGVRAMVMREGKPVEVEIKTYRQYFRKVRTE
jgi:hypothetical protein